MILEYTIFELTLFLLLYAFFGWAVGVGCVALKDRHFANRGYLNLPLSISEGITAVILLQVLPTMEGNLFLQFLMTWVVVFLVDSLAAQFLKNMGRAALSEGKDPRYDSLVMLALRTAEALFYLTMYLVAHPFVRLFVTWLPDGVVVGAAVTGLVLVMLDFVLVHHALRTGQIHRAAAQSKALTQRISNRLCQRIWARLEKAYPGVERLETENRNRFTFARGICFDKLVWVFLISSFLGSLIEMVFCRVTGGIWMNRSSVLYGPFSVVWGIGAVVLTVVLQRLAGKADRYVFLAGFVVGGAYEYLCSVFTEIVFGTVFWDYSWMPLNIGGRTNVLYCIFWGLLAVVWIKIIYPPMDKGIEKLPPLLGKILTWVIVFAMVCNGLLTALAMQRYTVRQNQPEPATIVEEFLDDRYTDGFMEARWPNMKIPQR